MNALLIISHGSRRTASNDEVIALADRIRATAQNLAVGCAFLEMADPDIATAIDRLIESGATGLLLFPHFLAAGTHVSRDIPAALDAARARHPKIPMRLLPHLGALPGIPALIFDLLREQSAG